MTWRRGFFRIWCLFAVPWALGFIIAGAIQVWLSPMLGQCFGLRSTDFRPSWCAPLGINLSPAGPYVLMAVAVPGGLLAIGAAIGWALSGFKSSSK